MFWILARILLFLGTHSDSAIFRFSHWLDLFPELTRTIFRYSQGFHFFFVLTRILPFLGSHIDWTLFPNSPEQFFDTHPNSFSILPRILLFLGTHPGSDIFRYSHWLDPFPVLTRTVSRYSHGFYFFFVLTRILPFLGTHIDWTLFQNSPEQFFDTGTDSTFSWYSLGFCHF